MASAAGSRIVCCHHSSWCRPVLYPQTSAWFSQREQARVIAMGIEALATEPNNDQLFRDEQLARAHAYNDSLASGVLVESGANVPTGKGESTGEWDYYTLLSLGNEGVMARLIYPDVGVDLPVYHGTSDKTLGMGVGHLQGSSLPVGGVGTRSVLTAHRGLADATMFTYLVDAEIGDTFTIETMGEVLAYQVVEYQVIAPDQTEALVADPTKDLVTLITCTPLGINTHRILVTGERIYPTPQALVDEAMAPSHLPAFPWWAVIFTTAVVLSGSYVWWAGYPPKPKKKNRKPANPEKRLASADAGHDRMEKR